MAHAYWGIAALLGLCSTADAFAVTHNRLTVLPGALSRQCRFLASACARACPCARGTLFGADRPLQPALEQERARAGHAGRSGGSAERSGQGPEEEDWGADGQRRVRTGRRGRQHGERPARFIHAAPADECRDSVDAQVVRLPRARILNLLLPSSATFCWHLFARWPRRLTCADVHGSARAAL